MGLRPWEAFPHLALPNDYNSISELSECDSYHSSLLLSSTSSASSSSYLSTEDEEDEDEEEEEEEEEDDDERTDDDEDSQTDPGHEQEEDEENQVQEGNKIIYNGQTLYVGDIVYMTLYPHVPFIIHKNIGNGFVEILKPDNTKECVEISCLQNALSFPSLHQDTKNENELRFRQSLLEDLSECQLDYLLVCME